MNAETLAQLLLDGLDVQKEADGPGAPYISKWNGLSDVTIDGDVDIVALAQFVLDRLP